MKPFFTVILLSIVTIHTAATHISVTNPAVLQAVHRRQLTTDDCTPACADRDSLQEVCILPCPRSEVWHDNNIWQFYPIVKPSPVLQREIATAAVQLTPLLTSPVHIVTRLSGG